MLYMRLYFIKVLVAVSGLIKNDTMTPQRTDVLYHCYHQQLNSNFLFLCVLCDP